jgi:hypothetical protein
MSLMHNKQRRRDFDVTLITNPDFFWKLRGNSAARPIPGH